MVNCSPVPCRIFTIELDDTQDGSRLVIDITEGWIWDNSGAGSVHRPRYFQYPIAR